MSALTERLIELYSYTQDEIDALVRVINERRRATWINALADLVEVHGCSQLPGTPKGVDSKELRQMSVADAESIARTFNRDLARTVERLYKANPRGNRTYYASNLDEWAAARDQWKSLQIALNTDSTARYYAMKRFYEMNPNLAQRFVASGPPPVCKICIRIFAAGVVDFDYVESQPLPAHLYCPHLYQTLVPIKADCQQLWLG